jgi:Lrp/AsnC family leucine-responsive transcriptional regulator
VKPSIHPKDWELLAILQAEGKATYADLARRVNLSQTAVHERVKKLEARGLIRGYCAMVDPASLGLPVTAFVFVEQLPGQAGDGLPDRFAALQAVVACHSIAGDETYLLKVRVADTMELERVIGQVRRLEGVGHTRCVVGLTTWFEARPVPPPERPEAPADEPPQTLGAEG